MNAELIIAIVSAGVGAFVGGILRPAFEVTGKWGWAKAVGRARLGRSWHRGWQRRRHQRRVEPTLDRVAALVSRQGDFKASHPFTWPDPPRKLWHDAAVQLMEKEVDWKVKFPEHDATVELRDAVMHVSWGDFKIDGRARIRSGPVNVGSSPNNRYWDWKWTTRRKPEPMIVGGRVTLEELRAGEQLPREEATHGR